MIGDDQRSALAVEAPAVAPPPRSGELAALVDALVVDGRVSAASAWVGDRRGVIAGAAAGDARLEEGGEPLYDLASLTKPWTASLALRLDASGRLPLATEIGEVWPRCADSLARRTLEELLRHRAGLRPWAPLYRRCRSRDSAVRLLLAGALSGARRGTYSDLGFVLWGLTAERVLGRRLGELLRRELVEPLGLRLMRPAPGRCLPCLLGNEREVELAAGQGVRVAAREAPARGTVQDGNARFLGGPAGHAGLFATPGAVFALAREWLAPGALWPAATVSAALAGSGPFALGWRRSTRRGSGGPAMGRGSYGHVGFTGGSVWVDPGRRRIYLLLTHRTAVSVDLAPARRRFHGLRPA